MAPRWIFGIVLGAVVAGAFYVPGLGGDARDVSKDMLRREAEVNEDEVSKDMLRREAEVNEDETSKDMLRREPGFRDVEVDESLKEKKKDKATLTSFQQKTEEQQERIMGELASTWTSDDNLILAVTSGNERLMLNSEVLHNDKKDIRFSKDHHKSELIETALKKFASFSAAIEKKKSLMGVPVTKGEFQMGHSACPGELEGLITFLKGLEMEKK